MIDTTSLMSGGTTANLDTAQIYTDLNGVQQLKALSKTDKAAALEKIAHQFESMMVQMMMKSMRDANTIFSDGDMTSGSDVKFYQDMFDNQLSLSLSKGRGFGIAEALMRQLSGRLNIGPDTPVKAGDRGLDAAAYTQSAIAGAVRAGDGDSHALTAIQETLHALFGNESSTPASKSSPSLDGTPAGFIESLRPLAQRVGATLGVDSDVLLSQAALETGWGQKVLQCADGSSSFNFFNIKAGENWHGDVVKVPTIEYQNGVAVREWASFRAYGSPEECFADYARLIGDNPRYRQALNQADDPRAYIRALADAGYATDPRYAQKVLAVFDSSHLTPNPVDGK